MYKKAGKRSAVFILVVFLAATLVWGIGKYRKVTKPNVKLEAHRQYTYIYVRTGTSFDELKDQLYDDHVIEDTASFSWVAKLKKFNNVRPGRFKITANMTNNQLVNHLRATGKNIPVRITINSIRTKSQLAELIGKKLEVEESELLKLLNDKKYLSTLGFTPETVLALFLPNTYEFYWNTSAVDFVTKMEAEYKQFWNKERLKEAEDVGLTPVQVSVLASIVQAEQNRHNDEKPTIAGLYLNRLRKNMRLQSDPTLIYAVGDFTIKRVLNKHKQVESPYNTYKYSGLPPGPINMPELSSLNAVLNFSKHKYLYMCAKEDFSGYHNFAKTHRQHFIYAQKYRKALDKRNIKR